MNISKYIKEHGLPSSTHVFTEAGVSKDVFYGWAKRFPRVVELLVKGLKYEKDIE